MATTGTVIGPQYAPHLVASEASGRKCVQLSVVGQYVQLTAQTNANAIVVRYSVPDTSSGSGTNYTLSLYTNGSFAAQLALTSRYSWLYGAYPFTNNPAAGLPRNFYDEVRMPGLSINPGDSVRLQKDASDIAANYVIDLVDLESIAPALTAPANSLSVTSFGAVGDGTTDCTSAFQNCINAAAGSKTVWIPAGIYVISATLNLPSNTTVQGAGMWYSTLLGSAALYTTPSRRINLNGAGSNIHLADFAITGFLNYRNDTEPNDGLGGSYGTGSTISRVWVEHTKAAAWLYNSSGLVVDSCRFRDTLADGINLNRGMRGTIVTNCTARGTGDDCFAIWPSSGGQNYAPGLNVITHCSGQVPFLANGGAIYGGTSNRIEDCLFQDLPYGCGVLLSTTFPVGANVFAGTTTVQQCDLFRCGGYDEGYGWRAALQICLDSFASGISNVQLSSLNISNSISDGLSIIGGIGRLSNAVAFQVSIPNYGLGASGRHGAWASGESVGSLTFSNSTVAEYRDDSPNFAFNFLNQPTRILGISISSNASVTFTYATIPGVAYHVEMTTNLSPAIWLPVAGSATNATASSVSFTHLVPSRAGQRFYRIASP